MSPSSQLLWGIQLPQRIIRLHVLVPNDLHKHSKNNLGSQHSIRTVEATNYDDEIAHLFLVFTPNLKVPHQDSLALVQAVFMKSLIVP